MTPLEIKSELEALSEEVGLSAYTSLDVHPFNGKPVSAVLYPYGITNSSKGYLRVEAYEFRGALDALRAAWEKFQDEHKLKSTREMALAIIRLTTELGECTDAALRAEFDPAMIARWGADACVMANEMAGKGPFSIVAVENANAA